MAPSHPGLSGGVGGIKGSVYSSLAARLAAHPGETYPFHVGDTWMEPPEGCHMEDLKTRDHEGLHRYAPPAGKASLLQAIVNHREASADAPLGTDNVCVTVGATGGLTVVLTALLDPGDEVILLAPYWPLIEGIVTSARGVPRPAPVMGEDVTLEKVMEGLEAARTARTVAVYWNTPHNPTGRVLPGDWLKEMVAWAREHGLWILADEVYEDYAYTCTHQPTRPLAPERTFSAHSFSKAYGMSGNRLGYVVGPVESMLAVRKVSTHAFYSATTAAQIAAERVFSERGRAWVAQARERYHEEGRWAAERLGVRAPEGSTFLFLDVTGALDERGLNGLLEDCVGEGLLVAPGPSFGPFPGHVRLCYTATEPSCTRRGVEILARRLGR
jgi:aspartate/methionine/tyrosine aminotransferase